MIVAGFTPQGEPILQEIPAPQGQPVAQPVAQPTPQPTTRPMTDSEETAYLSQRGLFRDFDGTIRYFPHLLQQTPALAGQPIPQPPPIVINVPPPPVYTPVPDVPGEPGAAPNVIVNVPPNERDWFGTAIYALGSGATAGGVSYGLQRILGGRGGGKPPTTIKPLSSIPNPNPNVAHVRAGIPGGVKTTAEVTVKNGRIVGTRLLAGGRVVAQLGVNAATAAWMTPAVVVDQLARTYGFAPDELRVDYA